MNLTQVSLWLDHIHSKWQPHAGQVDIIDDLLVNGFKDLFIQAGRNFGKTEIVSYLLWRYAIENPGSENYYFAPYQTQAKEIMWAPNRIQNFGPRDAIYGDPNKTEMRITLVNGSFMKLAGSDNVDSYRGIKPKGLSIYDEFKDFRPEFHDSFDPNRAAFDSPLIIIGSPPDRDCQYTVLAEDYRRDPKKRFYLKPTRENPYISKVWLDSKEEQYKARGEYDIWQREYEAILVKGGASKIFPMLNESVVKTHDEILQELQKDRKRIEWIHFSDPAAASVFGTLFAAYNPYTKKIYLLDEIYEKSQSEMTVKKIGPRIFQKEKEFREDAEWRKGYDEAATWFQNEMLDNFNEHFEPSHKHLNDKESGLTLIKDILLDGKMVISERCTHLYSEMDNYFKDKNGNIPKVNDHLIDCLRYILGAVHYELNEKEEEILSSKKEDRYFQRQRELTI